MTSETATEFIKLLNDMPPGSAVTMLIAGMLAWQAPRIIKELFAGVGGLLIALRQAGREPKKRKSGDQR